MRCSYDSGCFILYFFDKTVTTQNSKDTVKRILSENAINFLEENNELVEEVKRILGID